MIEASLFNPKRNTSATVSLDGSLLATVSADQPASAVWLSEGSPTVVITLSRKTADSYRFDVAAGLCSLPETSGNWFNADGKPLTQLSAARPHTPVFLSAGTNVISAANASLSTDYYVRDGGNGTCVLP